MGTRHSSDIAGDAPLTFSSEVISPLQGLHDWVEGVSLGKKSSPPPSFSGVASPAQRRALRFHLTSAVKMATTFSSEWPDVYRRTSPVAGCLAGSMKTGKLLDSGPTWASHLFDASEHAINSWPAVAASAGLLSTALEMDMASQDGRQAWLDNLPSDLALQGAIEKEHHRWALRLLDMWQQSGLARGVSGCREIEASLRNCVRTLDRLLLDFSPTQVPAWSMKARQVELRLSLVPDGVVRPRLDPLDPLPVYCRRTASSWTRSVQGQASWQTPACLLAGWLPLHPDFEKKYEGMFGVLVSTVASLPGDQRKHAMESVSGLRSWLLSREKDAQVYGLDHALMSWNTPPAEASSRRPPRL